jgi:SAM-dependent methyltransferase
LSEADDQAVGTVYDDKLGAWGDDEVIRSTVAFLAEVANGGPALELAIGTGRIAIPLAQTGAPVHGIDLSKELVAHLRAKPGGEQIPVTIGDFSTTRLQTQFALVYLVFNGIMFLTTEDAQIACFESVYDNLTPGGCFVVEMNLPALRQLPPGSRFHVAVATPEHYCIDEYEVAEQGLVSHHFFPEQGRSPSGAFRYFWPSELDLLARFTGMPRRERWSNWRREPFTSESQTFVGVFEKVS